MFHDYLDHNRSENRRALIDLLLVPALDVPQRDEYMDDDLAVFPYVNGERRKVFAACPEYFTALLSYD